ncbi:MAG: glycoside hydrolase family 3 C-terminal domain-containing protein [Clostridia bacterium]|nr:glycoside hydrolase family 3 C-terminal domain-containing protein [Clostridia bacterium]
MTLEELVSQMGFYSSALSRFGIPEYCWWNECLHGVARSGTATMFPQSIAMAASFDAPALYRAAEIISDEARIKHHAAAEMGDRGIYKGLTMWTPNINIFRDPRWGRGHETYGEDPCLTSALGVSFIRGLQGDDPKYFKCIATAKHYAVHSGPEELRHGFNAVVSRKELAETYLPAFRAAVRQGSVYSVMGAYNRVNGEPACASPTLLLHILRDEWGFDGYVVSDCGAVEDIYQNHKLADAPAEAAAMAVNNGLDLCCGYLFPYLVEAVEKGLVEENAIRAAVRRLFLARMKLGLFDPPEGQPYANIPYMRNDCAEHRQASLELAQNSIVMLKNDGILPLRRSTLRTVAVIGPNADSRAALVGNYAGTPSETYTVLEGLRQRAPEVRFLYAEGCALTGGSVGEPWGEPQTFRIAEALKSAQMADVSIVVLGLTGEQEGEEGLGAGDRITMDLPEVQRILLDALISVGKPMILVNMTGSPTVFPHEERFSAILQLWYPGQMGGLAAADVLLGNVSPSGRLPVTFYRDMAQVPEFTDYSMRGRTYRFLDEEPAYPFGYGLSYTRFAYDGLFAERLGEELVVRVTVQNAGEIAGREVVQAYVRWIDPTVSAPNHQLVAFESVFLTAGESVELTLHARAEQMCLYDEEGHPVSHPGTIEVYVGGGQPDTRTTALLGASPLRTVV